MEGEVPTSILKFCSLYVSYVAYATAGIGVLLLLYHQLRVRCCATYQRKYEIISKYEVKNLRYALLFILLAVASFSITFVSEKMGWSMFVLRIVIASVAAVGLDMLGNYILHFHYPSYIEKRLKRLRYKPRISPEGRAMTLLKEQEENLYLDEGMRAEESVLSMDYDVWIDEVSGYTKIEKYTGRAYTESCPACQYHTIRFEKEEIKQSATEAMPGLMVKHVVCRYCDYKFTKKYSMAPLNKQKRWRKVVQLQ